MYSISASVHASEYGIGPLEAEMSGYMTMGGDVNVREEARESGIMALEEAVVVRSNAMEGNCAASGDCCGRSGDILGTAPYQSQASLCDSDNDGG
jgi:hypothetical protein